MIVSPIPGTTRAHNDGGYEADSGLDITVPFGTPCFAAADGQIIYSEHGHTPWVPGIVCPDGAYHNTDTPNSVLVLLDEPFTDGGKMWRYVWYTHLSQIAQHVPDGSGPVRIKAGSPIGRTGTGRGKDHLHFGVLTDRAQDVGQTMDEERIAQLIWDQAPVAVAHPALGLRVVVKAPGGAIVLPTCHPEMEDGTLRVDARALVAAMGWGIALAGDVATISHP